MSNSFSLTDIYAVTDSKLSLGRDTITIVTQMLAAGVRVIQYREKNKTKRTMLEECRVLRRLTRDAGCCFIINDYVDIALLCDADGVHVGQDDIPLADVRQLAGKDCIIGVSVGSLDEAKKASRGGADYIGVGPVFPTATKDDVELVGPDVLCEIASHVATPIVAIGGITAANVSKVVACGVSSVAVVSAITMAENIPEAVALLRAALRREIEKS